MLIVCLAGFIYLKFSGALKTTMVAVQLLSSTEKAWVLIEAINFAVLTVILMLIVCFNAYSMFRQITSSQILQNIDNYDGDSTSDYF